MRNVSRGEWFRKTYEVDAIGGCVAWWTGLNLNIMVCIILGLGLKVTTVI